MYDEKDRLWMGVSMVAGGLIIVTLIASLFGYGIFYTLGEQELAVVNRLGQVEAVTQPGLHFKMPFISSVQKVSKEIKGLAIGYDIETGESVDSESLMITRDFNFVMTDFYVEYQVVDAVKAVYGSIEPIYILKNLAQSYIRDTIGSYDVDEVITTSKGEIQAVIKDKLVNRLEAEDIGIQVVNVTIQDAEPPTIDVLEAFKAVETAKQGKETALNNANKYVSEKIPAARAEADSIVQVAQAQKEARVNEANGQKDRFTAMYQEYRLYPALTKNRLFNEAMQEILPNLEIIIDAGATNTIVVPSKTLKGGAND